MTRTISSYSAMHTISGSANLASYTVSGTFSSSALGGTVTLNTPETFQRVLSDSYPYDGTLIITGAAGSKVKVEALNNTLFQLSLDANGDGTYETTSTRNWSDYL